MPKLFPISIEVEELAVGRVLRSLNTMAGVVRLHLNLTQDRALQRMEGQPEDDESESETRTREPAVRNPAVRYRIDGRINTRGLPPSQNPAYRVIAEILKRTPAHIKILVAALSANNIGGPHAINGFIHRMTKLKLIQRTAPGTYRLSPRGEKVFFGTKSTSFSGQLVSHQPMGGVRAGSGLVKNNYAGCRYLILSNLKKALDENINDGQVSGAEVRRILVDGGFSDKNLSTTGMKMRGEGLIKFNEHGEYSITDAGLKAISSPPPKQNEMFNPDNEGDTANG